MFYRLIIFCALATCVSQTNYAATTGDPADKSPKNQGLWVEPDEDHLDVDTGDDLPLPHEGSDWWQENERVDDLGDATKTSSDFKSEV